MTPRCASRRVGARGGGGIPPIAVRTLVDVRRRELSAAPPPPIVGPRWPLWATPFSATGLTPARRPPTPRPPPPPDPPPPPPPPPRARLSPGTPTGHAHPARLHPAQRSPHVCPFAPHGRGSSGRRLT